MVLEGEVEEMGPSAGTGPSVGIELALSPGVGGQLSEPAGPVPRTLRREAGGPDTDEQRVENPPGRSPEGLKCQKIYWESDAKPGSP